MSIRTPPSCPYFSYVRHTTMCLVVTWFEDTTIVKRSSTTRGCGVVVRSTAASVYVPLCNALTFESLGLESSFLVHLQHSYVKFVYHGHESRSRSQEHKSMFVCPVWALNFECFLPTNVWFVAHRYIFIISRSISNVMVITTNVIRRMCVSCLLMVCFQPKGFNYVLTVCGRWYELS